MNSSMTPCGHEWTIRLLEQKSDSHLLHALVDILYEMLPSQTWAIFLSKSLNSESSPKCLYRTAPDLLDNQCPTLQVDIDSIVFKLSGLSFDNQSLLRESDAYIPMYNQGAVVGFAYIHQAPSVSVCQLISHVLNVFVHQLATIQFARIDPLSQLLNRQTFDEKIMEIAMGDGFAPMRDVEEEREWYLALFDIDFFKAVNDKYGHVIGDEVILLVAQLIKRNFRSEDYVFRYGGEEFAVLFQSDTEDHADLLLDRVRSVIENTTFPQVGGITVSIGFTLIEDIIQVSEQVHKADQALYHSKQNGRNCVTGFHDLSIEPNHFDHIDIELF